jgi:formylglycine-generating enzyme required for sulfatase activity
MEAPRCFISYSWDSEPHREWVRKLATELRSCGVDAVLDQFHCAPGTDLTMFMERSVRESSFVLLVCTPNFAQKADAGVGGVGYEKAIVTGQIFAGEAQETKFVPLLREGEAKESLPSYLKSRLFIDFREDDFFENRLEELLRHFYSEPLYPPPPLGTKPDWTKPKESRSVKKSTASVTVQKAPLQQTIKNTIGMEFVLIPAGKFMMGGRANSFERPPHIVTLSQPFYFQTTQVTQGQWQKVIGDNPSYFKDCGDDCPVEQVSWNEAQDFIKRLNEIEEKDNYRLPTEAEWEYACRAGTTTEFFFGDDDSKLSEYGWYSKNSREKTHPVGQKNPNVWGLYDMHGNVWEWVEDDYHNNYEGTPSDGGAWSDKPRGANRVMRGGSWYNGAHGCRSAIRDFFSPVSRYYFIGFRLARSVALGP